MNELVVSRADDKLRIALLENKRLVRLHHEKLSEAFSVGDLFLGKVRKTVDGLNASFVNVGHPRDAFLHYFDLGPQIRSMQKYLKAARAGRTVEGDLLEKINPLPDINKGGKMKDVLKPGQEVLVQVVKEPISTKGPRLSSEISIPGQYVVIMPFSNTLSVSKKIRSNEERKRLKRIAQSLCPKNFGIIIRTAGEGKESSAIAQDIHNLVDRWRNMTSQLNKVRPPAKVLSDGSRATSILRDMLSQGFDSIHTDDEETYNHIHAYLKQHQPAQARNLRLYKGRASLFNSLGLEKQIKTSFGKVVPMSNGAYLVIEHTEAMHVIDVNSGSRQLTNDSLEATALETNLMAAEEIARQLQLRDMGGIIVVDFIDMKKADNRKKLNEHFKKVMKVDTARHSILSLSRFGLVQITRQRVRPQLKISTDEVCPNCRGTGKIQASVLITDDINDNVDFLMRQNKEKLTIVTNPYLAAYLTKGLFSSPQWKWFRKYGRWITVRADMSLPFSSVKYLNRAGEEINL